MNSEEQKIVAGVIDALYAAANLPALTGPEADKATLVWKVINEQLEARGLNYASIIRAQAIVQ
jgi:hypothetical protein